MATSAPKHLPEEGRKTISRIAGVAFNSAHTLGSVDPETMTIPSREKMKTVYSAQLTHPSIAKFAGTAKSERSPIERAIARHERPVPFAVRLSARCRQRVLALLHFDTSASANAGNSAASRPELRPCAPARLHLAVLEKPSNVSVSCHDRALVRAGASKPYTCRSRTRKTRFATVGSSGASVERLRLETAIARTRFAFICASATAVAPHELILPKAARHRRPCAL